MKKKLKSKVGANFLLLKTINKLSDEEINLIINSCRTVLEKRMKKGK